MSDHLSLKRILFCSVILCYLHLVEQTMKKYESQTTLNISSVPRTPRILNVISGTGVVTGIAVLRSELFVVRYGPTRLYAYNTTNFLLTRNRVIDGSAGLRAIVASPQHNYLYISDIDQKAIHLYDLTKDIITKILKIGVSHGLSLTSLNNVLVTVNSKTVKSLTANGSFNGEIKLNSSIESPQHSVQLSSNKIVVSHGFDNEALHRVCIVAMSSGNIVQCYGEGKGSGIGQLDNPRKLVVDANGNVMVADMNNNRIVLLSSSLSLLGYITPEHVLIHPSALHVDLLTHRLYIGEETNNGSVFVLSV